MKWREDKKRQKEYLRQWNIENRDKIREYKRKYYKKHKKKIAKQRRGKPENRDFVKRGIWKRNYFYKKLYNLSLYEYNLILEKQNGVCAICKKSCVSKRNLAVDHNHKTGKVRGLLCCNCNRGVGYFKENIKLLNNAIKYLKNT